MNLIKTEVLLAIRKKIICKWSFLILNTILYFLILMNEWQLNKCDDADFKYDSFIFICQPKNTRNQSFLIPNLTNFYFLYQTLQLNKVEDADLK